MNKTAILQLSLAMAIFGSIGFFSELTGLPAIELVFVRCVCAAIFLCTVWIVTGNFKKEKWNLKEFLLIVFCAAANLLNWIFLFKSFELISVTIAISLYHLAPMIVLIIGSFIFREKLKLFSILAITLCFIGTLFIMGTEGFSSNTFEWKGIIYGIVAAFFYAATMLLGKSITKTSVYATTFLQMLIGILILLPFIHFPSYTSINTTQWFYAVLTGVVHTGIVYLLFFNSIRHLSTNIVSFMIFVDPAVAILLDILLVGFRPVWFQWLGIFLIFSGLFYTLKAPKPAYDQNKKTFLEN
ncbi:DMT family transporter [Peribacillus huizhouensis]|uniref:Drug/metabolite transporter (DMT)-like permease n=1 Tax=Peribacillus huizhouensis TaxID=1501239 RepID=A0ABR6CR17_9BACI|nr:DMT family transporter [Peribacillus huizhouensis]MBA9027487.1 drug/metabolite transporter (DMT)-like permease [Peribacillus huizhouensis]